ncbi:hypothetical protein BB561_001510 [Smittium simulii]|uniref:AD domain-containing protein n=1 Tax=Smittium simulii TaxID=133385 RepID=A0A2T9YUB0_9FUNG|nr:hypothetical protein BB561_001510 [Smittium simulii]
MSYRAAVSRHLQKGEVKNSYSRLDVAADQVDSKNKMSSGSNDRHLFNKTDKNHYALKQTPLEATKPNEGLKAWGIDSKDKKKDNAKYSQTNYLKSNLADNIAPKNHLDSSLEKNVEHKHDSSKKIKSKHHIASLFKDNVGKCVLVKLVTGRAVEGKIFCYDSTIFNFQLPEPKPLPVENLRIAQFKVLSDANDQFLRIGENVSTEAQCIFDALSKTWYKENIIVLDEIIIKPPYNVGSCSSSVDSDTLNRVNKVLQGEKRRLAINSSLGSAS